MSPGERAAWEDGYETGKRHAFWGTLAIQVAIAVVAYLIRLMWLALN